MFRVRKYAIMEVLYFQYTAVSESQAGGGNPKELEIQTTPKI